MVFELLQNFDNGTSSRRLHFGGNLDHCLDSKISDILFLDNHFTHNEEQFGSYLLKITQILHILHSL